MSRKRSLLPDVYKQKKKFCSSRQDGVANSEEMREENDVGVLPSDTKAALIFLKNLFPIDKFEGRVPPIIMKHQLYSVVKNRTLVDKELGDLRTSGEIHIFKLGTEVDEFCIMFTEDYKNHVLTSTQESGENRKVIVRFVTDVVLKCSDISLNKKTMLNEYHFKDEEITLLVKASVLTVRDVGSWWLSIPGAGLFMKSYTRGRKAILLMIKRSKYKEILQMELEKRKLPKIAKLGIQYYIHDIIGADLVQCISTTSGPLLRLSNG